MRKSAPERAEIAEANVRIKKARMQSQLLDKFMAGAGGYDSAKKGRFNNSFAGLTSRIGFGDLSPDEAVIPDLEELRRQSRDSYRNNPIAKGIINKTVAGTIGSGLTARPQFDRKILAELVGLNETDIDSLQETVSTYWESWASKTTCDHGRRLNFPRMQDQVKRVESACGEVLVMFMREPDSQYGLRLRVMHPMQLCNPPGNNPLIVAGVESDPTGSYPIAYHFRKSLSQEWSSDPEQYIKIDAVDHGMDRPNILHAYNQLEPGQTRGVPRLASDLGYLKNIDRVQEANVVNELVRSYFTAFITTSTPSQWADRTMDTLIPEDEIGVNVTGRQSQPRPQIRMGAGAVPILDPGESVVIAEPKTSSNYEAWLTAHLKILGMSQSIPFEVLMDAFNSSYSASRAARLAWRKYCEVERSGMCSMILTPCYEEFIYTEQALAHLDLPGYWDDPRIARAYEGVTWDGDAIGLLDPYQEAKAGDQMVIAGFSTKADQTAQLTGKDWRKVAHQRAEEKRLYQQLGLFDSAESAATGVSV